VISPGDDLQPIVDAHVPGGSYLLLSGVQWMQSVEPKDGDSYNGETGTAMIGHPAARPVFSRKKHWLAVALDASLHCRVAQTCFGPTR